MNHCLTGDFFYYTGAFLLVLLGAPLLPGIVNRVKAFFAGRRGPSAFQLYYDLAKLSCKEPIYSRSTTLIFRFAPLGTLAGLIGALLLFPNGMSESPLGFAGDIVLFFYLMGVGRMLTMLAALDTASSFEGMGASREAYFSALAEIATLTVAAFLLMLNRDLAMSTALLGHGTAVYAGQAPLLALAAGAFFVILLVENCRVPFDDPETHLELTMIHEAMILDYAGFDLAVIHYAAALKLALLSGFFTLLLLPFESTWHPAIRLLIFCGGVLGTAVLVGIVESVMARYRFLKVPQMLLGAFAVALTAVVFLLIFGVK